MTSRDKRGSVAAPQPAAKKSTSTSKGGKLIADDVFNLMDFDQDGKIDVTELKEAILGCGIPADKVEIQSYVDLYNKTSQGKVDLKSFKGICKELKPEATSMSDYYEKQFKLIELDQGGMIDLESLKHYLKNLGSKLSESHINMFFKSLKKEENGKVKLSALVSQLASINVLV